MADQEPSSGGESETRARPPEGPRADEGLPLVSVLMSVYNAGEYLRPSVLSVLAQSYRNLELIIIDDGCSDGCMETIRDVDDPRIEILVQENRGKAAALNRALPVAKGEFLAIQDADDFSHLHRLRRQVDCLLENPDLAAVFTGVDVVYSEERVAPSAPYRGREECRSIIEKLGTPAMDPTGVYRRSCCEGVSFDERLRVGQVYDFILQIGEKHPMMVLGECLYSYRFHWNSVTKRSPELRQACIDEVFRRAGDRRGGAVSPSFRHSLGGISWNRERDNNLASHYIDSVLDSRSTARTGRAIRTGVKCMLLHPLDPHYWKAILYSVLPKFMLKRLPTMRSRGAYELAAAGRQGARA